VASSSIADLPRPCDQGMERLSIAMRERITRFVERVREEWPNYSAFVMAPLAIMAFFYALYLMLHDVM
jgi:hypothetical protein